MPKKYILFIIVSAFAGAIVGGLFTSGVAQANFFSDFWQKINIFESASETDQQTSVEPYEPTINYENAVINAVETASPSVVSVVVSKDLPIIERCPGNLGVPPEFRDFFNFDFTVPCERGIEHREVGGGSGFIISSDGMILTNKHVVSDTKADYTVVVNDDEKFDAKVLARDPIQDLAVLKIDANGLTPAQLGDSGSIRLGQTSIAIGNSLGEFRNTVSVGVVSGLGRTITASDGQRLSETIEGVIQTDAAINPGNSGGPLLNLKGEVIGINTAIVSGAQNVGFAIPINKAKRAIESVKQTGEIKVPYLGVRYIIVGPELAKSEKLPVENGALIRGTSEGPGILKNSPAEKAGLKAEDIILEVGTSKINKDNSLGALIQQYNIGESLELNILRNGEEIVLSVTLEERPDL